METDKMSQHKHEQCCCHVGVHMGLVKKCNSTMASFSKETESELMVSFTRNLFVAKTLKTEPMLNVVC